MLWAPGQTIPIKTASTHAPFQAAQKAKVSVTIYTHDFKKAWHKETGWVSFDNHTGVQHDFLGTFTIPESYRDTFFFVVTELKSVKGETISRSLYWPRCLTVLEQASTKELLGKDPTSYQQVLGSWIALDKGPWLKPSVAKTTTKLDMELLLNKMISGNLSRIIVKVINLATVPSFITQVNISGVKRCIYA